MSVQKERFLPNSVLFTRRVFLFISSKNIVLSISLTLLFIGMVLDYKVGQPIFIEKVGTIIALLGVLLSIKYRFVASLKCFKSFQKEVNGTGNLDSQRISDEEYHRICNIAREEVLGFWLIIFGSIVSSISFWSKILL